MLYTPLGKNKRLTQQHHHNGGDIKQENMDLNVKKNFWSYLSYPCKIKLSNQIK